MFYYISGKLAHLAPTFAVVEANGVGYKLTISGTTHASMPHRLTVDEPPTVKLYTYMAVREDGVELFGFGTHEELSAFKMLTSVSGVGPKMGIMVLSGMNLNDLAVKIATNDVKGLSAIKGLGKKTAERIIEEDEVTGNVTVHRKITAIEKLYDVSAVSLPANDATEISARNISEGVIADVKEERLAIEAQRKTKEQIAILADSI